MTEYLIDGTEVRTQILPIGYCRYRLCAGCLYNPTDKIYEFEIYDNVVGCCFYKDK